jgi:DNA-binding IclR family transcriptional regulator
MAVRMMNGPFDAVNPDAAAGGRVQSVQRATALLRAIADAGEPETASDLAERCGLNRSTAWRILATLEDDGIVERDPATNRYSIGYGVARLAAAAGDRALTRVTRPHLVELSRETGETVSLAVLRQLQLVYVDQVAAPHVMAVNWLGRAVPLHATSTGKALLAWLPEAELAAVLGQPLPRFTDATITVAAALREELASVRQLGYATSRGELEPPLWGASAAVLDSRERPIAVISVWGPESRVRERGLDELGTATAATAQRVAAIVSA